MVDRTVSPIVTRAWGSAGTDETVRVVVGGVDAAGVDSPRGVEEQAPETKTTASTPSDIATLILI
jgi:hypothetical protein